jgi:hypothetical protein
MPPRSMNVFKVYQLSTHRTLGFFTGDEDTVLQFCSLKYNVEQDDVAIERLSVRNITQEEVTCFKDVLGQLRDFSSRMMELEGEAEKAGLKEDLVDLLLDLEPKKDPSPFVAKILEERS